MSCCSARSAQQLSLAQTHAVRGHRLPCHPGIPPHGPARCTLSTTLRGHGLPISGGSRLGASAATSGRNFRPTLCMTPYLEGMATVDELYMPTKGVAGLTLRTFDPQKRQWSIYWVSSATGRLDPVAVVGGFEGNHGEFYAADHDGGRPIKIRYTWDIRDHEH